MLNDTGATCACITEEQMVILINHTQEMKKRAKMKIGDYNYPIKQMYKYVKPLY